MKALFMTCLLLVVIPHVTTFAETNEMLNVRPLQSIGVIEIETSNQEELKIEKTISDQGVFVECFVSGFTFSEENEGALHQDGEGHIRLYIDNEHVATLFKPAFIIEGLQTGTYDITVQIVKNDRSKYEHLEESFELTIP